MRVITENAKTYPADPARYFDFARFAGQTPADFAFFAGSFDFKVLNALPTDQHVVYLELEEPNRFFVPVPEFHHLDWDERFSKVFTLCPYTAEWLNHRHGTDRWVPAFFPFNEQHAPPPCTKEFDVIYTGGAHGPGIERLIQEIRGFNYRFVSQTEHPAVTDANCSYAEKLSLVARSKVMIVHNLLFATRQHVEQVWRFPDWRANQAFTHLPGPDSAEWLSAPADQFWLAPQLKSRLFEAAFCRSLILCQRDPWNVIERYFEPGTEFIYFEPDSLAATLRDILANFSRYEPIIARAHARAMRDYTTTNFFEKFLRPLDYASHSRVGANAPLPTSECVLKLQRIKSPTGSLAPEFLAQLTAAFGLRAFVATNSHLDNIAAPHMPVHQYDSAARISQILMQLSGTALVWLTGHSKKIAVAGDRGRPQVLEEIAAIQGSGRKDAVILIDSLHRFEHCKLAKSDVSSLSKFATVNELHAAVCAINPDYQFFVLGDVAIAFPATATVTVSPLIMALTISRLFDGNNLPVEEVIAAETLIAQAEGIEHDALCELPALSASIEQPGLGLHYRLWLGHVLLGKNDFAGAKREFSEIRRLGFKHWRAHWYLALATQGAGDYNFARSILDALVEAVPDFVPARKLRQKLTPPAAATPAPAATTSNSLRPMLQAGQDALAQLVAARVHHADCPLRLHLGCGEQHFDGYVNIDYPPTEHTCQTVIGADVFADITKLHFPRESVDEIRLHHVFEHFKRSEALALLIHWHEMLTVGGRLRLETPDLEGCARQLVSDIPFRIKQSVVRHCFGSQEAGWANHYDGWTEKRYKHVLGLLGFSTQTKAMSWPHPPYLANVEAIATKTRIMSRAELLAVADQILSEYMVADVPSERGMCEVWRKAMREFLTANEHMPTPVRGQQRHQPAAPFLSGQDTNRSCPVCQRSAPAVVIKQGQVYHQCPVCECVFTPRIDKSVIQTENSGPSSRHDQNQDVVRFQRLVQVLGRQPEHVVDFGCGQGETTRFLQSLGIQTVGIDQDSRVQLKDLADASVDGIMMVEVIEHLYEPQMVFKQFNRVLKTGGTVYIESSFADKKDLTEWGYLEPAIGHCTVHTSGSMAIISEKNGFKLQWLNDNVCCLTKQTNCAPETAIQPPPPTDEATMFDGSKATPISSVVVKLQGGLGNQMFQFAAGLALARRHNSRLKLDQSFLRDRTPRPNFTYRNYCLDLFQLPADCEVVPDASAAAKCLPCHVEQQFHFDPKFFEFGPNAYLDGYFQSPKFFEPVLAEVLRTFTAFTMPLNAKQQGLAGEIAACPAVCLHVRRGDFVANAATNNFHGACDKAYYHQAVAELRRRVPNAHFFIFSDDIEWCRTANLTNGEPFALASEIAGGDSFGAEFQLMTACQHFILPNSSFGWWAAFLSSAQGKIVVVPDPWFDNPVNKTVDLFPASWIRLPKNRSVEPLVSVVIPSYNQAQFLTEAVESVIQQTFQNWEIIVVNDGSPDDTKGVFEQLAARWPGHKLRYLEKPNGGPADARNAGINIAAGKYILPLDGDDKLHPEMLSKTVALLETQPELSIAYTDLVRFGTQVGELQTGEFEVSILAQNNQLNYCSLYRRDVWRAVGGYDQRIWGYEDWDFWVSCCERGFKACRIPEPLLLYRVKNSSMITNAVQRDRELRAQIVLNHPNLYPPEKIAEARRLIGPDGLKAKPPAVTIPAKDSGAPLVSVIVPTHNRPDWLGETLRSILAQTYREFEIIVVNDAGADVRHVIEPLNADGRIRLINHEQNKGLAGARNTGVRAARGNYIAYLDDDDIYYPQHLATLVAHAQASGADVVYSDAQRATQRKEGDRYVVVECAVQYSHDWDAEKILIHNFVPVLCFLHKKPCVEQAGWFDESLTTHEDWDLWMRMSRLFSFSHIKEVTCEFRWREDGSSMSSERRADFVRTASIIYQKHPEFVRDRPDLQARRQKFLLELAGPTISGSGKPAPGRLPVSIVIPVFNKVEFTQKCLARLAAIPCAVPHEIIVVDDFSSDETEAFCLAEMKVQSNLRYHRLPKNHGFGGACNSGAAQARGHWLVFLNNDTEPEPGWLEAVVARFESDPTIGIVGTKLLYPDRTVQHCGIEFFWADNPDHKIWPLHRHLGVAEHDPNANAAGQVAAVTGACLCIPRDLFHSLGGFSPEYPMYFEDTDLCFKSWQAGRKVFYEPKSVVIHYESQSSPNRERVDALNKASGEIFFKKWPAQLDLIAFDTCLEKSEGRFNYFRQQVLPLPPGGRADAKWLEEVAKTLIKLFHHVGPFYMHFGGAGDALLLLATFLDKHPDAQVISFPNSIPAARSFFEAFPSLKRVWFLPKNNLPQIHIILRMMMQHCPECLGMGITPEGDYFKDWHAGLDIFQQFKVSRRPEWTRQFQTQLQPNLVVLAPKGSLCGMVGSKRNIIDPAVWPQLIRFIQKNGYRPVIIGTPDESNEYPCPNDCEDRRSYSFREQMEQIANSVMLIAADSWAKTFSALAGIRTIVFEPIKGPDWKNKKDPSDFVFLDPWETITVVKDFEQCRKACAGIANGNQPAKTVQPSPSAPLKISWEGSFLDYGSLSHINRELSTHLAASLNLTCVGPNALGSRAKSDPEMQRCAKKLSAKAPADTAVTVRHQWPPNWSRPKSGSLVVIQPWEYGALPKAWVDAAGNVDEFWVPSPLVRTMYLDSGIAPEKVRVVPNGVDSKKFRPGVKPLALRTRKKFKFLFVGGTIYRKGPDVLLEAYSKVFTAADDVCLVIKDFGGDSFYQGQTAEAAILALQKNPQAPEILYLKEELSSEQMPALYAACDCFVLPYRGEGFGMPVLEAMACGLPVIVTASGATDSFVSSEAGWKIPSQGIRLADHVGEIKLVKNGWLLEPSKPQLGSILKHAASHADECRQRGAAGRAIVENEFDWNDIAAAVAHRLKELADRAPVKATAVVPPIKTAPAGAATAKRVALPAVAKIGRLDEARELFGQKNYPDAWAATQAAIARRPFHPEALLLLAEIALVAGDGKTAKRCAQRARELAPGWSAARQFLSKPLKGDAKLDWLDASRITHHAPCLSVCLIVKNEEKFLAQCLKSVRGFASQIVVVDTGSTDRTVEIAREFGAEIYSFAWCDDFAAARNAALEHATGDWILMLDADEELPAAQHAKLVADMKSTTAIAFRLPLVNIGQENEGRSFIPRLFRNAPDVFYHGRIHEQVFSSLLVHAKKWGLETALGTAEILHHGYTKEMVRDRNKVERNLKLLRAAIEENPADVNLVMNLGLEFVRSDDLSGGIEKYREAFEMMSVQPKDEIVPELREVLLTQFTSQLYKVRGHAEVVRVLNSPLAKRGGLTASLHFALGLAHFELKQFSEAADQMRQCLSKRRQPGLTPINTDILTAAPQHCLALSLAKLNEVADAEKAFTAALAEAGHVEAAKLDYAKFLQQAGRPVDALTQLHELVAQSPRHVGAWQLGGEIALSQPEFLEFARDWTGEAFQALPENPVIAAQRAEALMLNGDTASAAGLWEKLWSSEHEPRTLAALILCEAVEGKIIHAPSAGQDEQATSHAFIEWYQKLLNFRAQLVIDRINGQLEKLSSALPTAAQILETALSEAATPAEV